MLDNLSNNSDYTWVGANQKLYEQTGALAFTEMGARVYLPAIGRFLTADSIHGGSTTTYDYPNDPINAFDLAGQRSSHYCTWSRNFFAHISTGRNHTTSWVKRVLAHPSSRRYGLVLASATHVGLGIKKTAEGVD